MIHVGIDHHKRFSHVVAMDDFGQIYWDDRITSQREMFELLKERLPAGEPVQSVLEAGPNWGILYDELEALGFNPKLSNPLKNRLIGESFVKTDKIDATALAVMLRAGITPEVHVPPREVRAQKNLLRQRFWLVRIQTALKNRIHALIARNHVEPPEVTDIFGAHGRAWLKAVELPDPDGKLLKADLELLDGLREQIRQTEKWVAEELKANANAAILETLPGVGKLLAALIALEVDTVSRFARPEKLASYSGLVPSTYSSGGKTTHGGLIPTCNHHLRYAFIEAASTAVRVSPHFSAYYRRLRGRKSAQEAMPAVARKLCEVAWHCLRKGEPYRERPYRFQAGKPRTVAASGVSAARTNAAIKGLC